MQSLKVRAENVTDSKGRTLPRQMIRIQKTEPEENVVRTELRFVVYQSKKDLEYKTLYEDEVINDAVQCLMRKYTEMNMGQAMPSRVPNFNASKFAKSLAKEDLSKCSSLLQCHADKEWIVGAQTRLEVVGERVKMIEKSAAQIGPELAAFQKQLTSLLTDLEERKRAGRSSESAAQQDQIICEKLQQLRQSVTKTAHVRC